MAKKKRKKTPQKTPRRNVNYFKPKKFLSYMTLSELSEHVGKDPSWIRFLEKEGRIPRAQRVQRGKLSIRLWSPEQADEIISILETHQVGRPSNG
jgi:hypothetical protein